MISNLGGVILCGGQSRRMGRSKASLPFGNESMLGRVVRIVGEVALPVVVVAGPAQNIPELSPGIQVVRDLVANLGPLHGLATGLAALPDSVEFAFVASTDVPFLQTTWIIHLARSIGENDVAIARVGGFLHPLVALYRRRPALSAAHTLLGESRRRVIDLIDRLASVVLDEPSMRSIDPGLETLKNLNTPEAYDLALQNGIH